MSRAWLLLALLVAPVAHAGGFPQPVFYSWLGHLETAAGPVNDTVTVFAQVVAGDGADFGLVSEDVVVVDGDFVLDFFLPPVGEPLFLAITINGSALEPNLPLTTAWPSSFAAERVNDADTADTADTAGTIQTPLSRTRLASGDVAVPFSVLTGFPAAFADGDQGLAFTAGNTLDFSGGTLGIKAASLPGTALSGAPQAADLVDGTLATADLANGGVLRADLSAVPLTKMAPATLTGRHFAGTPLQLFEVTEVNCQSDFVGKITESSTCSFTGPTPCTGFVGQNQFSGHRPCAALNRPTDCFVGSTSACPNTLAGVLVLQ